MRRRRLRHLLAPLTALALLLAACGNDGNGDDNGDDGDQAAAVDGPTITVTSFNFPESTILAEVYAQALEDAGYDVARELDLGSRELIFPELAAGNLDLVPEYLGSALMVGFGEDAPDDVESGAEALRAAFEEDGVTALDPAPAENANAFVTSADLVEEHGLSTVADLEALGTVTFAGPPECETRDTCLLGLTEVYGLDVSFQSIQEPAARLAALEAGEVDLILLFSTDSVLAEDSLVMLEETEGIVPPENIVPVVRTEVVDAYGDELVALLDSVTERITTETLVELNAQADEGTAPATIAGDWLREQGVID
jgi:osmoprotectant transport system substrate-binding protein